jgi:pectate lyase
MSSIETDSNKGKVAIIGCLALITALQVAPAWAESANFGTLELSPGFSRSAGMARGFTGGSYSLSAIANRDRDGKRCLGFGDTQPDHIIVLQKDFSQLQIRVDTQGKDTTLVIKGPNNTVLCGDDTGANKDASVSQAKWPEGTYEVWVGAFEPGTRWRYTLTVQQ